MFRQLLRLSPVVCPNGRLVGVPTSRLAASKINPCGSADADKQKSSKLSEQRSNDLWESSYEFNKSVERPFASTSAPTDQELSDHLDDVLQNLNLALKDTNYLLNSIKPVLPQLNGHQVAIVYKALVKQDTLLRGHLNEKTNKFREALRESSEFAALLNQTNLKIREINPSGLTTMFKFMYRVEQNPDSEIVRILTEQIVKRLNEFNLDLVSKNLLIANMYSYYPIDSLPSRQFLRFRANLLENCRRRILNNELDPDNFKQLKLLFYNFFMNSQNVKANETLDLLTRTLLSDFELDFNRSIQLLGWISTYLRRETEASKEATQYPTVLVELIEKCNSIVCDTLKAGNRANDTYFAYLGKAQRFKAIHPIPPFAQVSRYLPGLDV